MLSRLATIAPDLEISLAAVPFSLGKAVALQVASWAVESSGIDDDRIKLAVSTGDAALAEALVRIFDQRYFATQESNPSESLRDFCRARAASATAFALRHNVTDSIYEAVIASDDLPAVRSIVVERLSRKD